MIVVLLFWLLFLFCPLILKKSFKNHINTYPMFFFKLEEASLGWADLGAVHGETSAVELSVFFPLPKVEKYHYFEHLRTIETLLH